MLELKEEEELLGSMWFHMSPIGKFVLKQVCVSLSFLLFRLRISQFCYFHPITIKKHPSELDIRETDKLEGQAVDGTMHSWDRGEK